MTEIGRKCGAALRMVRHPSSFADLAFLRLSPHSSLRAALYRYVDWRDRRRLKQTGFAHLPPAALRFRVHGDVDLHSFLQSGRHCSQDIRAALARVGKAVESFGEILDFGCGCGRTAIWFSNTGKSVHLSGTDIDTAAIDWCRQCLAFATFEVNQPTPPLRYQAHSFDLVYALSVFTHLNEDYQLLWLRELQRVTKPKGFVLLSLHGSYYWSQMPPREIEEIKSKGLLFLQAPKPMQGLFPEWYQNAYHSPEYVFSTYAQYFDILAYIPQGLDDCQDMVLMQRR
jgi:ubiquinone/menaquinone biosynthesis C-methylase UbiE